MPRSGQDAPALLAMSRTLGLLQRLWDVTAELKERQRAWSRCVWADVVASVGAAGSPAKAPPAASGAADGGASGAAGLLGEVEAAVTSLSARCRKLPRALRESLCPARYAALRKDIDAFAAALPVLALLAGRCVRPRHWRQLSGIMCAELDREARKRGRGAGSAVGGCAEDAAAFEARRVLAQRIATVGDPPRPQAPVTKGRGGRSHAVEASLTVGDLLAAGVVELGADVEELAAAAAKELAIESELTRVAADWGVGGAGGVCFDFDPWRQRQPAVHVLRPSFVGVLERLEDEQLLLQTALTQRGSRPFRAEAMALLATLLETTETLERWARVQVRDRVLLLAAARPCVLALSMCLPAAHVFLHHLATLLSMARRRCGARWSLCSRVATLPRPWQTWRVVSAPRTRRGRAACRARVRQVALWLAVAPTGLWLARCRVCTRSWNAATRAWRATLSANATAFHASTSFPTPSCCCCSRRAATRFP